MNIKENITRQIRAHLTGFRDSVLENYEYNMVYLQDTKGLNEHFMEINFTEKIDSNGFDIDDVDIEIKYEFDYEVELETLGDHKGLSDLKDMKYNMLINLLNEEEVLNNIINLILENGIERGIEIANDEIKYIDHTVSEIIKLKEDIKQLESIDIYE